MALYSFTSNNEQELSFEKGDRLEIVERPPSDPEWYRARDCRGQLGLVPRNYLQELADYLTQPYRFVPSCTLRPRVVQVPVIVEHIVSAETKTSCFALVPLVKSA